jgi:hypothetical protein
VLFLVGGSCGGEEVRKSRSDQRDATTRKDCLSARAPKFSDQISLISLHELRKSSSLLPPPPWQTWSSVVEIPRCFAAHSPSSPAASGIPCANLRGSQRFSKDSCAGWRHAKSTHVSVWTPQVMRRADKHISWPHQAVHPPPCPTTTEPCPPSRVPWLASWSTLSSSLWFATEQELAALQPRRSIAWTHICHCSQLVYL